MVPFCTARLLNVNANVHSVYGHRATVQQFLATATICKAHDDKLSFGLGI